jgi:hypothetical protein
VQLPSVPVWDEVMRRWLVLYNGFYQGIVTAYTPQEAVDKLARTDVLYKVRIVNAKAIPADGGFVDDRLW